MVVNILNNLYHEHTSRGTYDFPIELYSVTKTHPCYIMQIHWHKEFEIIRVKCGTLILSLNGKEFKMSEGESIFIPSGVIHSALPYNCEYECVVFSPSMIYGNNICRTIIKSEINEIYTFKQNCDIDFLFDELKNKKVGYELEIYGRLYLIMCNIFRSNNGHKIHQNKELETIKPAMQIIEDKYDSKISLDDLAKKCGLSPNYFSKYFKDTVGVSPFEYLLKYRIEAACEMLLYSNLSITQICYDCGFNDLSYFIRIFKKHKGISPKGYVKTIKNPQDF